MVAAGARTSPTLLEDPHANHDEIFDKVLNDLINSYRFDMMNLFHPFDDEGVLQNFIPSAFKRKFPKRNSAYNNGISSMRWY